MSRPLTIFDFSPLHFPAPFSKFFFVVSFLEGAFYIYPKMLHCQIVAHCHACAVWVCVFGCFHSVSFRSVPFRLLPFHFPHFPLSLSIAKRLTLSLGWCTSSNTSLVVSRVVRLRRSSFRFPFVSPSPVLPGFKIASVSYIQFWFSSFWKFWNI